MASDSSDEWIDESEYQDKTENSSLILSPIVKDIDINDSKNESNKIVAKCEIKKIPLRRADIKKLNTSPSRLRSPSRAKSPIRISSPSRKRSPSRAKSPIRTKSPIRASSPSRLFSLRKKYGRKSPIRVSSPSRLLSPKRKYGQKSPIRIKSNKRQQSVKISEKTN